MGRNLFHGTSTQLVVPILPTKFIIFLKVGGHCLCYGNYYFLCFLFLRNPGSFLVLLLYSDGNVGEKSREVIGFLFQKQNFGQTFYLSLRVLAHFHNPTLYSFNFISKVLGMLPGKLAPSFLFVLSYVNFGLLIPQSSLFSSIFNLPEML